MNSSTLLQQLPELSLARLGDESEAGLLVTSLPWPRAIPMELSLASAAGPYPTHSSGIGQWPGEGPGMPRRILLFADGNNSAPEMLSLSDRKPAECPSPVQLTAEMELFERSPHREYVWERHMLRLRRGDKLSLIHI